MNKGGRWWIGSVFLLVLNSRLCYYELMSGLTLEQGDIRMKGREHVLASRKWLWFCNVKKPGEGLSVCRLFFCGDYANAGTLTTASSLKEASVDKCAVCLALWVGLKKQSQSWGPTLAPMAWYEYHGEVEKWAERLHTLLLNTSTWPYFLNQYDLNSDSSIICISKILAASVRVFLSRLTAER